MKSKLIAALCVVLLFVPTYIAIGNYITAQKRPVSVDSVNRMVLTDLSGAEYEFIRGESSDRDVSGVINGSVIDFFIELNESAEKQDSLPPEVAQQPSFAVKYYSYNLESAYRYYFTAQKGADAYYTDGKGGVYLIKAANAESFLVSHYADTLYSSSSMPNMSISGKNVSPEKLSWMYLNLNGGYNVTDSTTLTSEDIGTYNVSGGTQLKFDFSIEPDYLRVKLLHNGEVYFDDVYENINQVDLSENKTLECELEAKWYESDVRGAKGEANYRLTLNVTAPPIFYLGKTTVEPGDFVVISGKNITDISKIEFTSTPDIGFEPTFFRDGDFVRALVPININLPTTGSYEFAITAEGVTRTMTLNMSAKTFRSQRYDVSTDILSTKRTSKTLAEFDEAIGPLLRAEDSTLYVSGAFLRPMVGGTDKNIRTGFGIYRTIVANESTYRHEGVDWVVSASTKVQAQMAGKVVYAGELSLTGKLVVIEHGFGLKTLYAHLSRIDVKVGDIVETGSILGIAGSTGFTNGLNLHSGMYVFDTPVCPYSLWDNELSMER